MGGRRIGNRIDEVFAVVARAAPMERISEP